MVEEGDARAFEEDLFDIAPSEQFAQRSQIRDRAQDALHHRPGVAERAFVAELRATLVFVDGALDLGSNFSELALRLEPVAFDTGEASCRIMSYASSLAVTLRPRT